MVQAKLSKSKRKYLIRGGATFTVILFLGMTAMTTLPNENINARLNGMNVSPFSSSSGLTVGVTGPLTEVICHIYDKSSTYQEVRHIEAAFYNSNSGKIIYVLKTVINAKNGANILAQNAKGTKSTIHNVMKNEGYIGPIEVTCIDPAHKELERRVSKNGGIEYVCVCVPASTYQKTSCGVKAYGDFVYLTPCNTYKVGDLGSTTLSISIDGSEDGVGVTAGVSSTYIIPDCTIGPVHCYPNSFCSYQQYCIKGQTYDSFTSMVETKYYPNSGQGITLGSQTNVTYCTTGFWDMKDLNSCCLSFCNTLETSCIK